MSKNTPQIQDFQHKNQKLLQFWQFFCCLKKQSPLQQRLFLGGWVGSFFDNKSLAICYARPRSLSPAVWFKQTPSVMACLGLSLFVLFNFGLGCREAMGASQPQAKYMSILSACKTKAVKHLHSTACKAACLSKDPVWGSKPNVSWLSKARGSMVPPP